MSGMSKHSSLVDERFERLAIVAKKLSAFSVPIVASAMLLAAPAVALAAEDEKASAPAGIGLLIFLLGLAAIGAVGFYYIRENQAAAKAEKEAREQ
jgi:glycerol uptake facilitator-like aquaporin